MTERYLTKSIGTNLELRQHGFMLIGNWDKDVATGEESLSLRFRTHQRTVNTNASTTTGEEEVAARAELPDLPVDPGDLSDVLNAGTDPITGVDLSNVSTAGTLALIKTLYQQTVVNINGN